MYRIDNTTAAGSQPATPQAGTAGYFTAGDPATALPATIVDAWWLNQVQEEILSVITLAGLTPNKTSQRQLYDAIQAIANADLSGYLPLTGGTLYNPGQADPLHLKTDAARNCMLHFLETGQHEFGIGVTAGSLAITDFTAGTNRMTIAAAGSIAFYPAAPAPVTIQGNLVCSGGANGVTDGTHSFGSASQGANWLFGVTDANGTLTTVNLEIVGLAGSGYNAGDLIVSTGQAYKVGGGSWAVYSDRSIKRDIAPYDRGLETIRRLEPVSYRLDPAFTSDEHRTYVGLLADDVLGHMPEIVGEVERKGPLDAPSRTLKTLDPSNLSYALIDAVKELAARVEALEIG